MAALAASRRLLHLRPELELCLRARAPTLDSCRSNGAGRLRHAPPRRRLVSCRQGSYDEGNRRTDSRALEPMEKSFSDEFMQISLEEEESDGVVCGISECVVQDVKKSAIESLAVRSFTVSELRKKLLGKNYPVDTVDSVMADFQSRSMELVMLTHGGDYPLLKLIYGKSYKGTVLHDPITFGWGLLNDGDYAESFSRSRWLSSTWGPRRIKQALRQKGVTEAEVDQATRRVFQDGHGHENQTMHGISEASMDHLFAQASKQWQRGQSLPLENRRARIVRWLQYRGFNWAVTNAIVRKLEAKHPP